MTAAADDPSGLTREELERAYRVQRWAFERCRNDLVLLEAYNDKNNILLRRVIAEMHETQQALEARNAELRSTQERLVEQERRAQAASQAKSAFVANISHEIRTPLNGILGVTELLSDTADASQAELLEIIRRSGRALLGVINNVLDISKIEAGKIEARPRPFELCALLGEVGDSFAPSAEEKGLELVLAGPGVDLPRLVRGDEGLLRRILNNLLNNAIKFTASGEVVVGVRVEEASDEEVTVRFEVRDTGVGIPADRQQEVFEAFAQVDTSTTRSHGGTGLGLTICREMLQVQGSDLEVHSVLGEGTTFSFGLTFPVLEPPVAEARPGRILLIEGHASVRDALEATLTGAGYTVTLGVGTDLPPGPFDAAVVDWRADAEGHLAKALDGAGVPAVVTIPWSAIGEDFSRWAGSVKRPPTPRRLLDVVAGLGAAARTVAARILVAEDNLINRKVVVGLLERAGHSCDLVSTGREAVEACAQTRYDLVFMDCQMPEMDGLEATAAIREHEVHRTPILALTAGTGAEERRRCLDAGMDGFLVKPIDLEALRVVLERYLAG